MNVTIVDYNSGNISSVINSFKEVAKDKVSIAVSADLNKPEEPPLGLIPIDSLFSPVKKVSYSVSTAREG